MRVGIGFDIHRMEEGRPLVLGGVAIPFERGLKGHSDADCVIHAVIDGLFGAAGLGDIGERFPDTDLQYSGANSADLLAIAVEEVVSAGFRVVNVDINVHIEKPKLSTYKRAMAERIAKLMAVEPTTVNVKAKTAEGLGPVGLGEAVAAQAVVTLEEKKG